MIIRKQIAPAFEDFIFDWDYETYLLIGGYGSGKSYQVALKIIFKLLEEKRTCLVCREVFETIYESNFSLFKEILEDMGLLTDNRYYFRKHKDKVLQSKSPLSFIFPNGSRIIFKGMDDPERVKSINGVSIVWCEECSEMKYSAFTELQGRIRTPDVSMHFFLSCNPIGRENWVYQHFFKYIDGSGKEVTLVDENVFYNQHVVIRNNTYYHHSTPGDNPWLPLQYIKRLDDLRFYDYHLYLVARWGRFGTMGTRVLPQLTVASSDKVVQDTVQRLGARNMYFGFDFGFEESFNAVISCSVDLERSVLYIWDEIYMNHVTDDMFAQHPKMRALRDRVADMKAHGYPNAIIVADNEDPKAIKYYRQQGYPMRSTRAKFHGSRLSNTRKIKRFRSIIVSPKCQNTIRELSDLTYKKDAKGNAVYDQFNIDPHSMSALWYALDTVTVADVKDRIYYSKRG